MFVVVGGGIAGVSCTEQLAELLPNEEIAIVSASPLIKACTNVKKLTKVMEDFNVEEKSAIYLETNYPNVKVIYAKADAIDSEKHELSLDDGTVLKYKKLCVCTGGTPKLLAQNNPYVLGIRDTETISAFQNQLRDAKRIVVVGNGGIATELTYEIENCEVIWAVRHDSIGATFFDAGAAEFFIPHLKNSAKKPEENPYSRRVKYSVSTAETSSSKATGVSLGPDWSVNRSLKAKNDVKNIHMQYKCEVKNLLTTDDIVDQNIKISRTELELETEKWPIYVQLTNDKVYGCDFVVSATGVIPNTNLFSNDLTISTEDGGIEVNSQMQTSRPDVYAAGDCCTATWDKSHTWFQMRLWTQARQMGLYAAQCIYANTNNEDAIQDICFDLFTHVTKFFGFKVILLGLYNCQGLGQDCELLLRMTKGQEYIKVVLQNGRVVGAVLIGETDLEETFENLILNQLDVSSYGEDLLNPDVDIEDYFD